jgi:hypothetical protein
MSPANRTQIELAMRRKLLEAQQAYQSAAAKTKALTEKYGKPPNEPGCHPELEQAMVAEAQALETYRRILKQFTDLILRDKRSE